MIYVIGDSFANGDEIGDFLLPNWTGYKTKNNPLNDDKKNKLYHIQVGELLKNDIILREKINDFVNQNRWPTLLGKYLNKPVINKAYSGKSIYNMSTVLVQDMLKIIGNNQKIDLIIVQLTSLHRFQLPGLGITDVDSSVFKKENMEFLQLNPGVNSRNSIRSDTNNIDKNLDYTSNIKKYMYLLLGDQNFFYGYLHQLLNMQLIAKMITGKNLVILRSVFDFSKEINFVEHIIKNKLLEFNALIEVYNLLDFKTKHYMFPSMSDIVTDNSDSCLQTRGFHLCYNTHKMFAAKIADMLVEKKFI